VLEGAGEGLDQLDDVGGVEGFAIVAGDTDQKRLDQGEVDAKDEVLDFSIGLVFLEVGIPVALVGKGGVILEDVIGEVVFENVRMAVHEGLKVEAVCVPEGGKDVLLAGGGGAAEPGFEVLDTLQEARRDGGLREAVAEELHDELELLGGLRVDVVHERAEALQSGDTGAVSEHVGYRGGIRFGPVGDGAGSTERFKAASQDAEEIHPLPERVRAVAYEGQSKLADGELGVVGAEVGEGGQADR